MRDSLLQLVLALVDRMPAPTILHSELEDYGPQPIRSAVAEGILRETADAEIIPRPQRYGNGSDLIVKRTPQGLFGVADGDDYCCPVALDDDDVRQYRVCVSGIAEKIRTENEIVPIANCCDDGLLHIGEKGIKGCGGVQVYLSAPNDRPEALFARLHRLHSVGVAQMIGLLMPVGIPQSTEYRRIAAADGIVTVSLMAPAGDGNLRVDWQSMFCIRGSTGTGSASSGKAKRTVARSIGTDAAAQAVLDYMAAKGITETAFGIQFQTTERTVRSFIKTAKMRRTNFEAMAKYIGVSVEALLAGQLPASVKRPTRP